MVAPSRVQDKGNGEKLATAVFSHASMSGRPHKPVRAHNVDWRSAPRIEDTRTGECHITRSNIVPKTRLVVPIMVARAALRGLIELNYPGNSFRAPVLGARFWS